MHIVSSSMQNRKDAWWHKNVNLQEILSVVSTSITWHGSMNCKWLMLPIIWSIPPVFDILMKLGYFFLSNYNMNTLFSIKSESANQANIQRKRNISTIHRNTNKTLFCISSCKFEGYSYIIGFSLNSQANRTCRYKESTEPQYITHL